MYIREAIPPLVATLAAVCGPSTQALVAHGRNRPAEEAFLAAAAAAGFAIAPVPEGELDQVFRCDDVSVLRLRRGGPASGGGGSRGRSGDG